MAVERLTKAPQGATHSYMMGDEMMFLRIEGGSVSVWVDITMYKNIPIVSSYKPCWKMLDLKRQSEVDLILQLVTPLEKDDG